MIQRFNFNSCPLSATKDTTLEIIIQLSINSQLIQRQHYTASQVDFISIARSQQIEKKKKEFKE